MKKTFTKEYILSELGCYDRSEVNNLPFINNKRITLKNLFDALPIKDFTWFLARKCELTLTQKKQLALHCAKQALPIFEKQHPEDKRVRECLEATEGYIKGNISIEELRSARSAANTAAYDTYDFYAAYAAKAAVAAAAAAVAAAGANTAYATAAVAIDTAADNRESIWEFCKTLK